MGLLNEILSTSLRRLGYSKEPSMAHVPGFPYVYSHNKSGDYMRAYTGWVYANVKRRAEQMASLQMKLMRDNRLGVTEVLDHPALELLYRVNNQMTCRELLEILYQHLDLAGEAFWHVDRGANAAGEPQSIVPLLPNRMTLVPGKNRLIDGWIYKVTDSNGTPKDVPLKPEEVVFFKEPDPNNLFRGMSIVRAAAQTIDVDDDAEKWNWHSFKHGTSAKPVFQTEQFMDAESLRTQYAMLQESWTGVEAANKPMILHSGLSATAIGMSSKDMEFIEGQKWTRDKLMAMFGSTKVIMGITDDVNRANAETSEYVFAKYMVKPRVEKVVDYINEFYLPMFKRTEALYFMIDDPVPVNADQETSTFKAALAGASWMTPNEVREMKGLDPLPDGNTLYVPSQLAPSGQTSEEAPKQRKLSNTRHKQVFVERSRRDKRNEKMKKDLSRGFTKIAKSLVHRKESFRELAEKEGGFHDQLKAFGETQEKKFKRAIKQYFKLQLEEVLKLIQQRYMNAKTWEKKAVVDEFIFDSGEFKNVGLELVLPILEETMQERGNEALFFIGSRIGFNLDNPKAQKFLLTKAGLMIKNIDETTREELGKTLSAGLELGEGIPALQDRVKKVFDRASDSRAESIARTEVIKSSNFASQEAWRQSNIVIGKEWLTAKDERVEPLCAAMDGKVISLNGTFFEKGESFEVDGHSTEFIENVQVPPLHPMCRCTLIPVLKGAKQVGKVKKKKLEPTGITQDDLAKFNARLDKVSKLYGN